MANETNVVVLPFEVVLAYPIVPKSPLPSKWSNKKHEWITTSMSPTLHVPKLSVFCAFNLLVY